jgi:FkbM family methyltransferase
MVFQVYVAQNRRFQKHIFDFVIADEIGQQWYDGSPGQETPERVWCTEHISEGMTVVDAGAHHGMFSMILAGAVGASGKVYAYDPLPSNADLVTQNAELNGFPNIVSRPVGLSDSVGVLMVNANLGNVISVVDAVHEGDEGLALEMVRLDDDLSGVHVDFLKMDVEGGELAALRGAVGVLAHRPIVNLELHNALFADRRKTMTEIFEIFDHDRWIYHVMSEQTDPIRVIDGPMDIEWLAGFDYPHIFGVPRRVN